MVVNNYDAITGLLRTDSRLSLNAWYHPFSLGINDIRAAAILEPNPNKGRTVGEGDMAYIAGSRREQFNRSFKGRDALESLQLLESACRGEKPRSAVSAGGFREGPCCHGYSQPQGGLDTWVFGNCGLSVELKGNNLHAQMRNHNFLAKGSPLVASAIVDSVDESIALFQDYAPRLETLVTLDTGFKLTGLISGNARLVSRRSSLVDGGPGLVSDALLSDYHGALAEFGAFSVTSEAKDALFLGLLLGRFYQDAPTQPLFQMRIG